MARRADPGSSLHYVAGPPLQPVYQDFVYQKRISHESWARQAIAVFSRGLCSHTPAQVQFDSPGSLETVRAVRRDAVQYCSPLQPKGKPNASFLGLWDCRSPRSAPIELEGETGRNKFRSGRCTSLLQGGGLRQKRGNSPDA